MKFIRDIIEGLYLSVECFSQNFIWLFRVLFSESKWRSRERYCSYGHFLKSCCSVDICVELFQFTGGTVKGYIFDGNFFLNWITIFYGSFVGLKSASRTRRRIFGTFWKIALQSILVQNGWNFLKILLMTSIINKIFSKIQWEYFMGHLLYWNWLLVSANALFFSDN